MDFAKLQNEVLLMQEKFDNYNNQMTIIKNETKRLEREIATINNKVKKTNTNIEKYQLLIALEIKQEQLNFLKNTFFKKGEEK